jgi:DNA polymerase III delta subunit
MITWLIGENSFEVREALKAIMSSFAGPAERYDAADLKLSDLPDLLMGMSLFSAERLVIIQDISTNAALWEKLPDWLPRINETIQLVFIDAKPDKRTGSYKALKAVAEVKEFPAWSDRDYLKAEQWVSARAKQSAITIDSKSVKHLVRRVGLDQWQLAHALDTLALLDRISPQVIDDTIPANPAENIFELFETALEGKSREVADKLTTFELQEDPYALFALLSSQALTLAAVTYASEDADPAKDFGIHPFVASKLTRHAKRLGKHKVAQIVKRFAQTDASMKRSKAEPWILIEQLLLEVSTIS